MAQVAALGYLCALAQEVISPVNSPQEPLVLTHTGRLPSEPTGATPPLSDNDPRKRPCGPSAAAFGSAYWHAGVIGYNDGMSTISLQDLAHDPDALLDRVEAGERLVVVCGGRPVAELRPVTLTRLTPRPFGLAAGAFAVPDGVDAPLPDDILREFEGR